MVETISSSDFQFLMKKENLNILDVREEDEYLENHLPSAIWFPVSELGARVDELDHNVQYYVVCRTGNRSLTASEFLSNLGFKVINVEGGMTALAGGEVA